MWRGKKKFIRSHLVTYRRFFCLVGCIFTVYCFDRTLYFSDKKLVILILNVQIPIARAVNELMSFSKSTFEVESHIPSTTNEKSQS